MKKFCFLIATSLIALVSWAGQVTFDFSTQAGLQAMGITAPAQSSGVNLTSHGPIVVDGVTLTAIDGGTNTRVWNSQGNYTLRVYVDGAVTLSVDEGSIVGVTINAANSTNFTLRASTGNLVMDQVKGVWSGSAGSVSFFHTDSKNAQIASIEVITSSQPPTGGGGGTTDHSKFQLDSIKNLSLLPDGTEFQLVSEAYVNYVNGQDLYLMQIDSEGLCEAAYVCGETGINYNMGDVIPAGWTGSKTTHNGLLMITSPDKFSNAVRTFPPVSYEAFVVTRYLDYILDPAQKWENFKVLIENAVISSVDNDGNFTVTSADRHDTDITVKGFNKWNVPYPHDVAGRYNVEAMVTVCNGEYSLLPISVHYNEKTLRLWQLVESSFYHQSQVCIVDSLVVGACVPQERAIYVTDNATSVYYDYGDDAFYAECAPHWVMLSFGDNEDLYNKVAQMKVIAPGTVSGVYLCNDLFNPCFDVSSTPVALPNATDVPIIYSYDLSGYDFFLVGNECINAIGTFHREQDDCYMVGNDRTQSYHLNFDYAPQMANELNEGDRVNARVIAKLKMNWGDWLVADAPSATLAPSAPVKCKSLATAPGTSMGTTHENGPARVNTNACTNYEFYLLSLNATNAVQDVDTAKAVASVDYINAMGQVSAQPHHGINIVRTTYTDGSLSTTKVLR